MTQQEKPLPSLSLPRKPFVGEHAFEGDLLDRRQLAERLTSYMDRLREGAVLAIDAPWGEGKSWFGRNWAKHLDEQEHKVVFIDAFEQDYSEDPFLLIAAEISEVLDSGEEGARPLRQKAASVAKAILPMGTKVMLNLAGRLALGSADLSEEFRGAVEAASAGGSDMAGQWVEKRLEEHAQEKVSVQQFRDSLAEFSGRQDKPVVIFIDELDRCRPTFAVQLIERLKHFFDVPNLVFILLLNRDQLEKAVKGVYGADTDASAYLSKFVNFFFLLPKQTSVETQANDHVKQYVNHVFDRYSFSEGRQVGGFSEVFGMMASLLNLSLRDIERGVALYAFAQPVNVANHFLAYVIALKVSNPNLFNRLIKGDKVAHGEAQKIVDVMQQKFDGGRDRNWPLLNSIRALHEGHISGFTNGSEELKQLNQGLWNYGLEVERLLPFLAERIDLPMER
ncbi:P-loop NTPase fold protein [Mariprofundus sp. KV]|uniref:KAP family P-loop NTPase fold protein n=1 Tax=Mariprofundus sp. KV TaxID=2608715 RepID=UPI0015A4B729|nr:P-loop NTPase fold protein [Mariprofundus sp. KV]NWF36069.1 hypothetical protein [Mariprofundus sp. KV]